MLSSYVTVIPRAEMLGSIKRGCIATGVIKTTTTSMLAKLERPI